MKICVVTGSRADYGLLYWLMHDLRADRAVELQIAATGMHLAPEYGETWREIERDEFRIDARVETVLSSDNPTGVAKSVGLGLIGFADVFARLAPAMVVLLGDRYEILAAAQAAYLARIPIAHIAGGDVTEGSFDEASRHSITKMAHLHFVTNDAALRRVRQLGEDPARIFNVGSPGLDYIRRATLLDRADLEAALGIRLKQKIFLVTFHPVTLDPVPAETQLAQLLIALDHASDADTTLLFTRPNSDTGGRAIARRIDDFVAQRSNAHVFTSLGQARYISLMAQADVVIGNSSSGLYEAPTLKKPAVDIGNRQKGRPAAQSVIRCEAEATAICEAIGKALALDCSKAINPYGDGHAAPRILAEIKRAISENRFGMKRFHDLPSP